MGSARQEETMIRRIVHPMVVTALVVMGLGTAAAAAPEAPQPYIVVLNPGHGNVGAVAADLARVHNGDVGFVYENALEGFSVRISPQGAAALARNPEVAYVEPDRVHSISAQEVPTGISRIFADDNPNIDIDGADDFRVDVDVAIIDTGIDFDHPDLDVVGGVDCSGGSPFSATCDPGGDDDHFHGTH
ncbi:MAG: peptidase S8/S53 subtilisin kexin sedolisin, partial [Actinobacteria bacterium]|nr:peptidase S8/S53 subtilisin kexin sedolisin [Actinomycetota bacterium]